MKKLISIILYLVIFGSIWFYLSAKFGEVVSGITFLILLWFVLMRGQKQGRRSNGQYDYNSRV